MKWTSLNLKKSWVLIGPAILIVTFFLNTYYPTGQPKLYLPIGDYPTQIVNNTVPDVVGPAVINGEDVSVTAIRCSKANKPVDMKGQYFWQMIDPAGYRVAAVPLGPGILQPGCATTNFLNKMPLEVITRSESIFQNSGTYPIWQITGFLTAYTKDGIKGQTKFWQTQNFTIVVQP